MRSDLAYWVALTSIPEVGEVLCRRLVEFFGSPKEVFHRSEQDLQQVEGIGPDKARVIRAGLTAAGNGEAAEREIDRTEALGGRMLTLDHPGYPARLREIADPPLLLSLLGNVGPADGFAIAVVGSRNASEYGLRTAARIVADLARKGLTVVSGGARGIDAVAHRAALQAGGRTIAVLGSGLDVPYPPENKRLFREIAQRGTVMTEFPLGTTPDRGNFPRRNRLISGLALGVIVVEAAQGSGSLITASAALEQGREVFAVPGQAGAPTSRGTNGLIRQGACLTESADDVFRELHGVLGGMVETEPARAGAPTDLTPAEAAVYRGLGEEPRHVDRIAAEVKLGPPAVLRGLLSLELKGSVRQLPGGRFMVQ